MQDRTADILARQNSDGGWGWHAGKRSWSEPSAYALLALAGDAGEVRRRGVAWLLEQQAPDGGWRPYADAAPITTATALACLVPEVAQTAAAYDRGIDWLMRQKGRDATWTDRILQPLFGKRIKGSFEYPGWPFVPETAPWVIPTALAILALGKAAKRCGEAIARAQEARAFLVAKACADGGWNYGAPRVLDIDAESYPETTGIALLALAGSKAERAIEAAQRLSRVAGSAEGACWLTLALRAHGRPAPAVPRFTSRTTMELALETLAAAADDRLAGAW